MRTSTVIVGAVALSILASWLLLRSIPNRSAESVQPLSAPRTHGSTPEADLLSGRREYAATAQMGTASRPSDAESSAARRWERDQLLARLEEIVAKPIGEPDSTKAATHAQTLRHLHSFTKSANDAHLVVEALEQIESAPVAEAVGRIMQFAQHPSIASALARIGREGGSAEARIAALVGLRGRPTDQWLGPTLAAWQGESDLAVLEVAARGLALGLSDPQYVRSRTRIRSALLAGLDRELATHRSITLKALLADREPTAEAVARTRASLDDPSPIVRAQAPSTLRVLEHQLRGQLARRAARRTR